MGTIMDVITPRKERNMGLADGAMTLTKTKSSNTSLKAGSTKMDTERDSQDRLTSLGSSMLAIGITA